MCELQPQYVDGIMPYNSTPLISVILPCIVWIAIIFCQELWYLGAILSMKKGHAPEKVIEQLNQAVETHFAGLKAYHTHYYYPLLCASSPSHNNNVLSFSGPPVGN